MSDLLQQIKAKKFTPETGFNSGRDAILLSDLEKILEGMVVVPSEPTQEMVERGHKALMEWDARTGDDLGISDMWKAMLPLPQPTLAPDGDGGERG